MAEVLTGGPPPRRGSVPRWAISLGVLIALTVLLVAVGVFPGGSRTEPAVTGPTQSPASVPPPVPAPTRAGGSPSEPPYRCPGRAADRTTPLPTTPVAALLLPGTPASGGSLDRSDPDATSGPWAVVVRRRDGSLARHSAVVTYPVTDVGSGRAVRVGDRRGRLGDRTLIWSLGGARARVRGDLGPAALLRIAAATRVVDHRPVVRVPAGYVNAASGPYRPAHVHEVRYPGGGGTSGDLGGLVYTGVTDLAGFEDQLLAGPTTSCGTIGGRPAVLSGVGGGNGRLAWQPARGQVAYVGNSGSALVGSALGAVHELAERARPLDARGWRATRPLVVAAS